jgi:hypothetical protein
MMREARIWRDFIYARFHRLDPHYKRLDKSEATRLLAEAGLPVARLYKQFASAADIDLTDLPHAFVLKPTSLSGSRGVMVLQRTDETDGFWDALWRRHRTPEDIVRVQAKWQTRTEAHVGRKLEFIAEQRLFGADGPDRLPLDYRVYTFLDEVRLIQQIDRNEKPPREVFFVNEFETVDDGATVESSWKIIGRGKPCVPDCAGDIVRLAKRVCTHLATPFVRVDCFATSQGAVVGELTFTPGGPYYGSLFKFTPAFDEELGGVWREANKRLGRENPFVPEDYAVGRPAIPKLYRKRR